MGWILVCVIAASLLLSWWALPELRSGPLPWARRLSRDLLQAGRHRGRAPGRRPGRAHHMTPRAEPTRLAGMHRHWLRVPGVMALLIVPPMLAWWLHDGRRVAEFGVSHGPARNDQIAWLLQGEKLAPPPLCHPRCSPRRRSRRSDLDSHMPAVTGRFSTRTSASACCSSTD